MRIGTLGLVCVPMLEAGLTMFVSEESYSASKPQAYHVWTVAQLFYFPILIQIRFLSYTKAILASASANLRGLHPSSDSWSLHLSIHSLKI